MTKFSILLTVTFKHQFDATQATPRGMWPTWPRWVVVARWSRAKSHSGHERRAAGQGILQPLLQELLQEHVWQRPVARAEWLTANVLAKIKDYWTSFELDKLNAAQDDKL